MQYARAARVGESKTRMSPGLLNLCQSSSWRTTLGHVVVPKLQDMVWTQGLDDLLYRCIVVFIR